MKKKHINQKNQGITIILVLLITTSLLLMSLYILNFALTEKLISNSQALGSKTYYLAESGINEMVWLIQNDATYKNNFETLPSWTATTSKADPFGPNSGSYTTTITNTSPAHGEIVSVGSIALASGKSAQRRIKTLVYRPIGVSGVASSSGYADGNIDISGSIVNFLKGDAHSNNVFTINNSSVVTVEADLRAVGNYLESASSNVTVGGDYYAQNLPNGSADIINMPAIDFDSADPGSYINRASVIYSESDFDDLLDTNQVLTLSDPITYVTGNVDLRGAQTLILDRALLIVEKDFTIGFKKTGHGRTGPSNLYIYHASNTPAGILVGRHANFDQYTGIVDAEGLVYATDQLNLTKIDTETTQFDVVGGLLARKLTMTSCWHPINITHDNEILFEILGTASSSQTVIIEHWEEEY